MKISQIISQKLLTYAREVIMDSLRGKKITYWTDDFLLREKRGLFVTLTIEGKLRGCIGTIESFQPLVRAIPEMALAAAFNDPRFPPLTESELPKVKIEISLLSPLRKITDYQQIRLGIDGIVIVKEWQRGVYLPDVATKTGWTKEELLDHLCVEKAGLKSTSWRDGEAEIFIFQTQQFLE